MTPAGCRLRAHPRMRGEHSDDNPGFALRIGSSPHARGAHQRDPCTPVGGGLIPACAGSTIVDENGTSGGGAHPRMRGEHPVKGVRITGLTGSSPHARGALRGSRELTHHIGLIPACAGSTPPKYAVISRVRAHPRMRGEHRFSCENQVSSRGSSPHARGARDLLRLRLDLCWLIPACAGSTTGTPPRSPGHGAHPRMRGEHPHYCLPGPRLHGSSPHARGALGGI